MSVVCGREIGGEETTFGTSGYTFNNTFVLYDRATDSVWYPLKDGAFDAISGPRKGERIEFLTKPPIQPLRDWLADHPKSVALLEDRSTLDDREQWRTDK